MPCSFSPTLGTALNITLLTYVDACAPGIDVDTVAIPDVDRANPAASMTALLVVLSSLDTMRHRRSGCSLSLFSDAASSSLRLILSVFRTGRCHYGTLEYCDGRKSQRCKGPAYCLAGRDLWPFGTAKSLRNVREWVKDRALRR